MRWPSTKKPSKSLTKMETVGKVNTEELEKAMRSLGQSLTEAEVKEMINKVDKNGSGTVDIAEYRALICKRLKDKDKEAEAELEEAFKVFDKDGSGHISAAEIREVMPKLNVKLSNKEVDEMIEKADIDKNGFINYEEFVKILMSKRQKRIAEGKKDDYGQGECTCDCLRRCAIL
ncbi:unnamed protein product [Cuscuta epithymum]|uniref:EF-hand domain-containing protein n=1 Tax=Cuscuta epithymum TaxID=186058 RepID=A0AAV0FGQ2_9ASTE|nr:unnamed protein product [Cuscuta epithymum]